MLQKLLLVGLCVVVWVLFCGVFLSVAETIVGRPVLLCGYCFVECFLVLKKPLLVRLCFCAGIVLWSVSLISVAETIIGWPVCCCVGILLWSVS